jgi:nicotinate-nucleotide adenylyltransferase
MKHARAPFPPHLPCPSEGLAIGVMGGSFDPPHSGHAHVINVARQRLGLDAVWVFPAAGNPLKRTQTAFAERFAAAEQAFATASTRVSPLEEELALVYTVDLLRHLKQMAPRAHFVWIMGGDGLAQFHLWRAWRAIARLVPIAVISRPGATSAGLSRFGRLFADSRINAADARTLPFLPPPAWTYLTAPFDAASSTELRAMNLLRPVPLI